MTATNSARLMPARNPRVFADQVAAAFGGPPANIPLTVLPNLVVGLFLVWIMHGDARPGALASWYAVLLVFQLSVPAGLRRAFWRAAPPGERAPRWGRLFALEAIGNGLIWGSAGALFFPANSPIHLALLTALLCGMAAGAIPVTAMLLPAFFGAAVAMLAPLIARTALEGGIHLTLAGMLVIYLVYTLNTGRVHNRLFVGTFQRRLENLALIDRLTEQTALAEAAREEAEQANLAKSRFLAAASHDLRQPLHALSLFAGALLDTARGKDTRRIAGNIHSSVESLAKLLNELLDISRLDAGVVVAKPADLPLEDILERLRNDFRPVAREAGLRLRLRNSAAAVHADPVLLEQILRNLLANAIRYTPSGTVLLAARRRGPEWRIEVRDSGSGIAPAEQQRVFEEFYQIDNPERDRGKGLGLGLSIVRRLTTLLGFGLDLRSAPGRGSVFAVTVPAGRGVAPVAAATPAQHHGFDGLRVLVIDDDAAGREAMASQLARWDCETLTAGSQEEARDLLAARAWRPTVVFSDYRLRGAGNGVAALGALRGALGPAMRGVLVTGDTGVRELREVREAGFPLLHKPVAPAKLRALLQHLAQEPTAMEHDS